MTHDRSENVADSDTAQAFEELRGEVSLVRRALEGLTAAREPDYSATLAEMSEALAATLAALERIEGSPAVRLSPEAMAVALVKASTDARAADARLIHDARDTLVRAIGRIDGIVARGTSTKRQARRLLWSGAGGALAGMLLWSVLPGAIARSLPGSWQVPEWMAARTIGTDERAAGLRLIALAEQRSERDGE